MCGGGSQDESGGNQRELRPVEPQRHPAGSW